MRKPHLRFSIKNFIKNPFKNDSEIAKSIYMYYFSIIYFFIAIALFKLVLLVFSEKPDYGSVISYGEKGTILIATLALLTFTYASVMKNNPEKEAVIRSGRYVLKSVLNFVIGLIFLIGFRDSLTNPSNVLRLPAILFEFSIILMIIFFLIGFVMLILSGYFLAVGITDLIKSL